MFPASLTARARQPMDFSKLAFFQQRVRRRFFSLSRRRSLFWSKYDSLALCISPLAASLAGQAGSEGCLSSFRGNPIGHRAVTAPACQSRYHRKPKIRTPTCSALPKWLANGNNSVCGCPRRLSATPRRQKTFWRQVQVDYRLGQTENLTLTSVQAG